MNDTQLKEYLGAMITEYDKLMIGEYNREEGRKAILVLRKQEESKKKARSKQEASKKQARRKQGNHQGVTGFRDVT